MIPIGLDTLLRTPGFRRSYLLRGLGVWVLLRAGFALLGPGATLSVLMVVFLITMTVGAVLADARRRNEDLFLANLGVSATAIGIMAGAVPFLVEILLMVGR